MKSINLNLQQLQYIVAVDAHRHFATAAEKCFVTQPTLSMMIKKMEDELGTQLFDRSRQPVVPTPSGEKVIRQARVILAEVGRLAEMVDEETNRVAGDLSLGIIPTAAPYLLPLFVHRFSHKWPKVKLHIKEMTTEQIMNALQAQELDAGILATPLRNENITEHILYYEKFVAYMGKNEKVLRKKQVTAADLQEGELWLLEEGHCLRNQVLNLCKLKKTNDPQSIQYESGSISTLIKMVNRNGGVTIIPELAIDDLDAHHKKNLRYFREPAPVREMSLVTYKHFAKKAMLAALKNEILEVLPDGMQDKKGKQVNKAILPG
jgi:LysR family hydrogen peroxide-inducible transcriptional activator